MSYKNMTYSRCWS